jgi:hypothetical protein
MSMKQIESTKCYPYFHNLDCIIKKFRFTYLKPIFSLINSTIIKALMSVNT